ncbi:replication of DNA [Salmonella enterica]|uniref:Replication of DNA n=1 Tax=Salmonella enterica TaxID=28901 RepID=A0A5U2FCG1_SALER|nr:replication of DNA [Salmonella enterica]
MSNVAYANFGATRAPVENKVASLDDGYMRLATSISRLKPKLKMAGREHQVFDAVIDCTYGWNKSEDKVTNTYLAEMTGLDDSDVAAALNVLAERKIINLRKIGGFKLVSVNVNIDQWQLNKLPKTSPKMLGETTQKVGRKKVSGWVKPPDTKDSLTKDNIKTPLPPNGGGNGQVKPERRKAERIDYESFLNAYNTEVGDRLPHAVAVNEKRKRRLKKIIPQLKTPNVDGFRAYVRAFVHQAKPFYFGDNDTGWTADFDYLLREDSLTGVREGKFADRGIV